MDRSDIYSLNRTMNKTLLIILFLFTTTIISAQSYKYEIGAGTGIGFYIGDANPNKPFSKPGAAFDMTFRWNINYRWALKCGLSTATMRGESSRYFPSEESFSFKRQLVDLGVQAEFNFFNYGMGQTYLNTKRISPYILAGVYFAMIPKAGDGFYSLSLPLGVGVKYKPGKRWNMMLEFSMRKTLGDKLDGKALDDPYLIESAALKNTDWYSYTMFTVTYDFGRRRRVCNNIE